MPDTIRGVYKNGQVILDETPFTEGPVEVLVTFTGVPGYLHKPAIYAIEGRLKELLLLSDGWLNGEGLALKKDGAEWFLQMFARFYKTSLPMPCIYPTPAGSIQAEWTDGDYDISLTIDLDNRNGFYQCIDHANDKAEELNINLAAQTGWQMLNTKLLLTLKGRPNE